VAGYTVTYTQTPLSEAVVALYAFPDHAAALASLSDPYIYWGHGDTTLVPLSGLGDAQSFRAYGGGRGASAGITFVDGSVVVYVRAEDDGASDTSGADAVCDALAAAEDALLQATPVAVSSPSAAPTLPPLPPPPAATASATSQ
jgi:hypothetical protein